MAAVAIAVPTRALPSRTSRAGRSPLAVAPSRPAPVRLTPRGRLAVAALGLLAVALLVLGVGRLTGASTATASAPAARVASATHLVQPGDSLWSIARSVQPEGDVRPLVDRLSAGRRGKPLVPGERIVVTLVP